MMLFRKILFYLFLLLYLIICPLLILYTLGYVYEIKGDQGLVKTGAVSISTLPEGAEVIFRDHHAAQKTPAVILNLRPGTYPVRIEKKGHVSWQNTIQVDAERATVLEKIILLPAGLQAERMAAGPFEKIIPLKDIDALLTVRGPRFSDAAVLDLEKNTETFLAAKSETAAWAEEKVDEIYTVPESTVFWLWLKHRGGGRMVRIRFRFRAPEAEDWTRLFPDKPSQLQWDPGDENKLYVLHNDGVLTVLDLEKASVRRLAGGLQGFGVYRQKVFMVSNQGAFRADAEGHLRPLLDDPVLAAELFREKLDFSVRAFPGGNLIFLDSKGALFSNRLPYWIARKKMQGFDYDTLHEQAAVWSGTKIGILDFSRDVFLREEAFERKLGKRWIYREGRLISRAFWVAEGTQLVFQDGHQVFLLETAPGIEARPRLLFEADPESLLFFSESLGQLYYRDGETHALMAFRLVAKRELLGRKPESAP